MRPNKRTELSLAYRMSPKVTDTYYTIEEPILKLLYEQKNGVHVFGYNSAESERIRMKLSGAGPGRFWERKFQRQPKFCFFCPLNNARFHRFAVGQILRHITTTTLMGVAM